MKEDCPHYFELFCTECIDLGHHLHKPNNWMKFLKKAIEAYESFKERAKSSLSDMESEKKSFRLVFNYFAQEFHDIA